MNGMYTVDIETAKKIERMRKILAPLLIAALIISGLFVPKMNVKAAGSFTLTVNITNAEGSGYRSTLNLTSDNDDNIITFTIPASSLATFPVNAEKKIGTKILLNVPASDQERLFSNVPATAVVFEMEFGKNEDTVLTFNKGGFNGLNYTVDATIVYETAISELHFFASDAGTDEEVISPVYLSSVTKEEDDDDYYGMFPNVTLSSELVPDDITNGITEFTGIWRDSEYGIELKDGVATDIRLPLDYLRGASNSRRDISLTPVYDKINLPVSFSVTNGAKVISENEEKDSPYVTEFSSAEKRYIQVAGGTQNDPVEVREYYDVTVTLPSATENVDNKVFIGWRISDSISYIDQSTGNRKFVNGIIIERNGSEILPNDNYYLVPGTQIQICYPANLASDGSSNDHQIPIEATYKSVSVNYVFDTDSDSAFIAEAEKEKTIYASKFDFDNSMYVYDIPLPEVTIAENSGLICSGYELDTEDYANYTPWLADKSSPVSGTYEAGNTLSIGFFPENIGNGNITLHFVANISGLSEYKLRIMQINATGPNTGDPGSVELSPIEHISGKTFKYEYVLPDIDSYETSGLGWVVEDSSHVIERSDGTTIFSSYSGILPGEKIYITVSDYGQSETETFVKTDGFIYSSGNYNLGINRPYFLTAGNWAIGKGTQSDGYTYRVTKITTIEVEEQSQLNFTK